MKWIPLALLLGCSAGPVTTKAPPKQALAAARARLLERGIQLDEAGDRPDRVRTMYHCHVEYQDFDITFVTSAPAPRPFEVEGTLEEQAREKARCPYLVRGEVTAQAETLIADAEWWRLDEVECAPLGNALVGKMKCHYDWRSAAPPDDARTYFSRLLRGL